MDLPPPMPGRVLKPFPLVQVADKAQVCVVHKLPSIRVVFLLGPGLCFLWLGFGSLLPAFSSLK